jgi:peptidoglycan-N-acetylglucosamine deacetylase
VLILALISLLPALLLIVLLIQPVSLVKLLARLNPRVLYFVPVQDKRLALTIDDGPHSRVTPAILDLLQQNDCHATFFLLGKNARENQTLVARIKAEGHEVANHLMEDYPSILLSKHEFENQLIETERIIQPVSSRKWFRPGSGWFTSGMIDVVKRHDYSIALGSVYPQDTLIWYVPYICWYILRKIFPGCVIILHDGTPNRIGTVHVLRRILPIMKSRGYKIVTLSELATASNPAGGKDDDTKT